MAEANDTARSVAVTADDLPLHSCMVRRFTTFDRYHASLLASTQPNRRYLHGAQSGGYINNYVPIKELGHQWPTYLGHWWQTNRH